MKTTLYMAISIDGYVAGLNDETPWSDAEWDAFQEFVKTCDVVLLGRRTYEIMRIDGDFVEGPEYIVVTNDQSLDTGAFRKVSIKTKDDLPQVERLGIIGGGDLNGTLAKLGVINEVILDIEPITLGSGIRLFGDHDVQLKLELAKSRRIGEGTVQNRYLVIPDDTTEGSI
ncbi:MAG: dihydrofolate reductase family protein [Candidatus Woesebacteria bacterium]|jgi:dihydrofolate reductase